MNEILAFIRARLDEEERVIAGSGVLGWLTILNPDGSMHHTEAASLAGDGTWIVAGSERAGYASAVIVHREVQRRRDIEAKRRVLERHRSYPNPRSGMGWRKPADEPDTLVCRHDGYSWPCPDVRDVAESFADHPDYREEWRPA